MKVVLLDSQVIAGYDYSAEQKIVEEAGFEFVKLQCKNEDEVIEQALDADAVLNIAVKMTEKSISRFPHCQVMVRYGIGVNEFDMEAATKKGIKICNVSTYCIPEVAIHATAILLALSRQLKHFDEAVGKGLWNKDLGRVMRRPNSQTVGLIGFGHIAKQVSKNVMGLGYKVMAYDPYLPSEVFAANGVEEASLDELFANADLISLHLPETAETANMIDSKAIDKMKDGVIIVNAARGGLINQEDLVQGLKLGKIGGVGLDTFPVEPMTDKENPLLHMDNVIISPHVAYNSKEANGELFEGVAKTAVDVLNGQVPANVLNRKALGL
ncbi:MAG: C-terminal binding protein [Lachnospiraceae bacterium]|nr:C-terminal binding protein [Lachnospiraceae bacterium]